jgi:hypothetical protein
MSVATTAIIHGGATSKPVEANDNFFKQFTSNSESIEGKLEILACYWARPEEQWERLLDRDGGRIDEFSEREYDITILDKKPDISEELAAADVIYIAGGQADLIEPFYQRFRDLRELAAGKVIIGSSMGMFMLSQHYILSSDDGPVEMTVKEGLGLLDINTLAHWDIEPQQTEKISALQKNSDYPTIALDEGEWAKIYI